MLSDYLRSDDNNGSLFIGLIYPNKSVSANTIWAMGYNISNQSWIGYCNLNSPLDSRGSGVESGKNGDKYRIDPQAWDWSREYTSARFYKRDLIADPESPERIPPDKLRSPP